MESVESRGRSRAIGGVQVAGLACAIGGAGWVVSGLVLTVAGGLDGGAFAASQIGWILVQTLLLVGVIGLAFSGATSGIFGTIALAIALLGRLVFVAAEFHSLITGVESFLLPVGAMVTAVGMTLVGIAVIRAGRWSGWRRFAPLICGVYPFVAMFPFIAISDEPSFLAISIWGIAWIALGAAIYSQRDEEPRVV